MYIENLSISFDSCNDFLNYFGTANLDKVELTVPNSNEILIQNKKNDNSLSISLLKEQNVLKAGKTYTISCDFVLDKKITRTLPFDVPKIALDGIIKEEVKYDVKSSTSIPNEVGIWHKSFTVTVPENFSKAWFRIHAGIEKDAGNLLIKNITITETNFEFNPNSNLFIQDGGFYLLRHFTVENAHILYKEFSKLIHERNFKTIAEILKSLDDSNLRKKAQIYTYIIQDDIINLISTLKKISDDLLLNDEILVTDSLNFLARKLEWVKLNEAISLIEQKGIYLNSCELLYIKAQLCRRLKNTDVEKMNYVKALSLDIQKPDINWNLFFDKHNPGLTYRREELQFLHDNLSAIQKIADYYQPININFNNSSVFVFWDQGYDKAPPIVKTMIDRMKRIYRSRLVFLTSDNIEAYLDLSSGIQKFRETRRAFFSDYIRTELLLKYGGTWIDSTVFITEKFDSEVTSILTTDNSNFYALRIPENPYRISSWFEATNQINNRIIALMYGALLIYAEKYNDIFEYYQYHSFFELLTQLDEKAHIDFLNNYRDSYQPHGHDLLNNFRNDWDKELFNTLISNCPIQKLTYRSNLLHLRTHSFYKTILRDGINL